MAVDNDTGQHPKTQTLTGPGRLWTGRTTLRFTG